MLQNTRKSKLFAGAGWAALASGIAFTPLAVSAQDTDQQAASNDTVIVTGTRIKRTEFALPVPSQTLDRAELDISGANELSEAIVELPAVTPAITTETSQSSTQDSGSSTISLRNLGSQRTLTLIDGRRTVGNTSTGSTISLSTIPDAFVERIEVITGGASALYGSDAVTGVVNVILRDDFEGVSFESRVGTSQEGGNTEYGFEFAAGSNLADDRGNVMVSFEYDKETAIRENQRDLALSAVELDDNTNDQPDELAPNLSSNIPGGLFGRFFYFDDGGAGPLVGDFDTDVNGFNFLGPETISIPRERYLLAAKFNYELTDHIEFFASAQYSLVNTRSERVADTANSSRLEGDFPLFLADGVTPHPFVPEIIFDTYLGLGLDAVDFRRRWIELGNRFREAENDTLRLWAGFKGDLDDNWSYEVNFGFGEWRRSQSRGGDLIIPNYLNAINVEFIDSANPDAGLQCANEFARDAGCVPLNIFGLGSVTQDQADWIILRDQLRARNRTTTVSGWITGDLVELWAGPVSVAAGYDFRQELSRTRWDPISTSGGGTVTQQVNQDGEQSVHEGFVEVVMPLLRDAPFAKSLAVEGAVRVSDYSTVGSVLSWKAGGTWQPIEDVRFRGVYAVANRAPNNIELFSRGLGSQGGLDDPCDNVTAISTGAFDDTCRQDPIVAGVIASDGLFEDANLQVQQPSFGNDELTEETAKTITAGAVFTPRVIPGFQLSADYYNIKIEDAVGDIDSDDILSICYTSGDFAGTPSCAIPVRNAASGQLAEVRETSLNLNELSTEGVDVTVLYRFTPQETGIPLLNALPGDVQLSGTFTRVIGLEEVAPVPGAEDETFTTDFNGLIGAPRSRARFSVRWTDGPFQASWRTAMVGSMLLDDVARTRLNACQEFNNCDDKIALFLDRELTHNFRVSYELEDVLGGDAEVYAGVNNITNNQGPNLLSNGNVGENSHSLYDITGRFFYGGVRLRF